MALAFQTYDQFYLCLAAIGQSITGINGTSPVIDPQTGVAVPASSFQVVDKARDINWQNFSTYFQIYAGSMPTFFDQAGGNYHQEFTACVAIYTSVLFDAPQQPIVATQAIWNLSTQVRNVLHLRPLNYQMSNGELKTVSAVPIKIQRIRLPETVGEEGDSNIMPFVMSCTHYYQVQSYETYSGLRPQNLGFTP